MKRMLQNVDPRFPPIDFDNFHANDFMGYILSLRSNTGKRLGISSYNNKRAALYHLFRLYGHKQSIKFVTDLSGYYSGLKRKIALEKQSGDGRIQTGKSPLSFATNVERKYNRVSFCTCIFVSDMESGVQICKHCVHTPPSFGMG